MMDPERPDDKTSDVKSVYCGPGLWYDPATQRIHARLAHTHLPKVANYQGVTDPRRVPLLVVPANSTPLFLDGARHLRARHADVAQHAELLGARQRLPEVAG